MFGLYPLDGSPDESEVYLAEVIDDSTRLTQIDWCRTVNNQEHFRGFNATFTSGDGSTVTHTYATPYVIPSVTEAIECFSTPIPEEVQWFELFRDSNDIEGFIFEDWKGGTYTMRANGNSSERHKMLGRPIGFHVHIGDGSGGYDLEGQPVKMSIIYNACNCPASSFMADAAPQDMETRAVSGPVQTKTIPYQYNYMEFVYEQDCGTYTVKVLPNYSFVTTSKSGSKTPITNLDYWDTITLQSNSVDDVGRYPMTMTISQEAANGDGFTTPYQGYIYPGIVYDFTITINPCTTSLSTGTIVPTITYTIGDPTVTTGAYTFVQTPACGYTEVITVTNLPLFARSNKYFNGVNTQDFTIQQTFDLDLAGSYTVNLHAKIEEPTDYTKTSYTIHEQDYDFTIQVIDPCPTSSMDAWSLNSMTASVYSGLDVYQFLPDVQDSVSKARGDSSGLTFCGPRTFYLDTPLDYLTLSLADSVLNLRTNDQASHGGNSYNVNVWVALEKYPAIKKMTTFTVNFLDCSVSDLGTIPVRDQYYDILMGTISFSHDQFLQEPDCGYNINYSYQLCDEFYANCGVMPAWIVQDNPNRAFTISTWDVSRVGVYQIKVSGSTPLGDSYSEDMFIKLEIGNPCIYKKMTAPNPISDIFYYIVEDGIVPIIPVWAEEPNTFSCPNTATIQRIISGVPTALTASELLVLANFNGLTGSFDLSSNDYSLVGETWTIQLSMTSDYSTTNLPTAYQTFDITFRDICQDLAFTKADPQYSYIYMFQDGTISININNANTVPFSATCPSFTYSLTYVSGPLSAPDISWLTFTQNGDGTFDYSGTIPDSSWIGTHKFQIQTSFGSYASGSEKFLVHIRDACSNSVVNFDSGLVIPLVFRNGAGVSTQSWNFNGPKDSVSDQYGNGYDICGPLTYTIENQQDKNAQYDFFTSLFTQNPDNMDTFVFKLDTLADGTDIGVGQIMKVQLTNYPESTPAVFIFTITYKECFPASFTVEPLLDRNYTITHRAGFNKLYFDQAPCDFQITLSGYIVLENGRIEPKPSFISLQGGEISKVSWVSYDPEDIGEYTVRIFAELDNYWRTTIFTDFNLTVTAPNRIFVPTFEDHPLAKAVLNLTDQSVEYTKPLKYCIEKDIRGIYGNLMDIKVTMGLAAGFTHFDSTTNCFEIDEGYTNRFDAGNYTITVKATFVNDTLTESYKQSFNLEITCTDCNPLQGIVYEDSKVWVKDKKLPIRNNLTLGEYHPDQPIPYIESLTLEGLLVIGWDRTMTKPNNYSEINPSRVAVLQDEEVQSKSLEVKNVRNLAYRYETWFLNETNEAYLQWMLVVEALELQLEPGDQSDASTLNFTWEMIDYTRDRIWIQLYFEYPNKVSEHEIKDTLSITFWGTEYFKSYQGVEVRFGTQLKRKILRQISPDLSKSLNKFGTILGVGIIVVILVFVFIAILFGGDTLPIWMFLNSMQLIVHMPLFECQVPANVAVFLRQLLNITRFKAWPISQNWLANYGRLHEGPHTPWFDQQGYRSLYYTGNMGIFIVAFFIILSCWLIASIKDLFVRCYMPRTKVQALIFEHEPWMHNFTLRFLYYLFLEILICLFISSALIFKLDQNLDQTNGYSDNTEREPVLISLEQQEMRRNSSLTSWTFVILLLFFFVISIGLSITNTKCPLFTCCKNIKRQSSESNKEDEAYLENYKKEKSKKGPQLQVAPVQPVRQKGVAEPIVRNEGYNVMPMLLHMDLSAPMPWLKRYKRKYGAKPEDALEVVQSEAEGEGEEDYSGQDKNEQIFGTDDKLLTTNVDVKTKAAYQPHNQITPLDPEDLKNFNLDDSSAPLTKLQLDISNQAIQIQAKQSDWNQDSTTNAKKIFSNAAMEDKISLNLNQNKEPLDLFQIQKPQSPQVVINMNFGFGKQWNNFKEEQHYEGGEPENEFQKSKNWNWFDSPDLHFDENEDQEEYEEERMKYLTSLYSTKNIYNPERDKLEQIRACQILLDEKKHERMMSQRFTTLYYGLKLNRESTYWHPILYLIRRLLYALSVVYLDKDLIHLGLIAQMLFCVIYLCILSHSEPWKDHLIRKQHACNEVLLYFMFMELLLFNGFLRDGGDQRYAHGAFLGTLVAWCIFINICFILYNMCHICLLHQRRANTLVRIREWRDWRGIGVDFDSVSFDKSGFVRKGNKVTFDNKTIFGVQEVTKELVAQSIYNNYKSSQIKRTILDGNKSEHQDIELIAQCKQQDLKPSDILSNTQHVKDNQTNQNEIQLIQQLDKYDLNESSETKKSKYTVPEEWKQLASVQKDNFKGRDMSKTQSRQAYGLKTPQTIQTFDQNSSEITNTPIVFNASAELKTLQDNQSNYSVNSQDEQILDLVNKHDQTKTQSKRDLLSDGKTRFVLKDTVYDKNGYLTQNIVYKDAKLQDTDSSLQSSISGSLSQNLKAYSTINLQDVQSSLKDHHSKKTPQMKSLLLTPILEKSELKQLELNVSPPSSRENIETVKARDEDDFDQKLSAIDKLLNSTQKDRFSRNSDNIFGFTDYKKQPSPLKRLDLLSTATAKTGRDLKIIENPYKDATTHSHKVSNGSVEISRNIRNSSVSSLQKAGIGIARPISLNSSIEDQQ